MVRAIYGQLMWNAGSSTETTPILTARRCGCGGKRWLGRAVAWLELLTDQVYGATCVPASIDERSKPIARIPAPGICELLQLG